MCQEIITTAEMIMAEHRMAIIPPQKDPLKWDASDLKKMNSYADKAAEWAKKKHLITHPKPRNSQA